MITYPVTFDGFAKAAPGLSGKWHSGAAGVDTTCTIPRAFEGEGDGLTPEDHFLLAVQNCFVATFKVFAHYSKLGFDAIDVDTTLTVDKDDQGLPCMKAIRMQVQIHGASDSRRAVVLARKTMSNGFILRSVKSEIAVQLMVNGEEHAL